MSGFDSNLYSRQIRTLGIDTMLKLKNIKVLIVGMRGLGIEIAKNIVLSGVKEVKILDKNETIINDLGNNFFFSEENIGKARDLSCLSKLKALNPYVNVDIFRDNLEDKVNYFDVVVITEILCTELLFRVNEKCHNKNVVFIYCLNLGLSCFVFCDFGSKHLITDPNGKERMSYFIKNIDQSGVITIDQRNGEIFSLHDDDLVKFKEIHDVNALNDGKPRQIKFISKKSFKLKEKFDYDNYKSGGIVEEVILPEEKNYKKLKECFYIPYIDKEPEINDYSKIGRNELLHCALLAVQKFYDGENRLPEINNEEDSKKVLINAKIIYENAKNGKEDWIRHIINFDNDLVINVSKWSKCEISPLCSFLGGIVSQEIIKTTGKYIPIDQWLWFDFFETIEKLNGIIDRNIFGSRYDDQIAIFGNEIQKKLNKLNIFIIGAGALGCEFLKNLSLMGVSNDKESNTIISDNDLIEISNLNRQFLFHNNDIRKHKSKIAVERAKLINKDFNCINLELLVNEETEIFFNETFWKKNDVILTAVDNKTARKYIDNQCTKYTKILIDSGTLGTNGSSQVFVPFKTCCYNDILDIPEPSIPLCTLRNFPSKIEHCIEWALDKFSEFFTIPIEEFQKFLEDKESFYDMIRKEGIASVQLNKLKEIKFLLDLIDENNFGKIIEKAVQIFYKNYDYNIQLLLKEFPEDFKNKDGSLFWSGSKRIPKVIKFNVDNDDCFNFIKYYSILLAKSININIIEDQNYIKNILEKINLPENYVVKNHSLSKEEEMKEIVSLKNYLNSYDIKKFDKNKISPQIFEKDNDANHHVFFINICSNLRANNYRIPTTDELKTKMIAGKIIPAIASTTAAITGFSCMQLYTLLITDDISQVKNCCLDTSFNYFQINNPADPVHMKDKQYNIIFDGPTKAIPSGWTVWDIIDIKGPMTCQQLFEYFQKEYDVKITTVLANGKTIIFMFMPNSKKKLNRKIDEIYENDYGLQVIENYLWLEINGKKDNFDVVMPKMRYYFK